MDLGLRGKTALVLGAGGGLGRAITKSLAEEGVRVAVGDIKAEYLDPTARHRRSGLGRPAADLGSGRPVPDRWPRTVDRAEVRLC